MRQLLHQQAVLEGARLHFVGVADEVFRAGIRAHRYQRPFHAGGKAGAAATTQVGVFDHLLHRLQASSP
jgi:hypothetical protein